MCVRVCVCVCVCVCVYGDRLVPVGTCSGLLADSMPSVF